jgi:uncharacterized membrane protein
MYIVTLSGYKLGLNLQPLTVRQLTGRTEKRRDDGHNSARKANVLPHNRSGLAARTALQTHAIGTRATAAPMQHGRNKDRQEKCYYVDHKSQMVCLELNPGLCNETSATKGQLERRLV